VSLNRRDFLRTGATGLVGALAFRGHALPLEKTPELTLYVGTYTTGKSEGIYTYQMNLGTGGLKRFAATTSINPSFLTIHKSKRYLYAVNEVTEFAGRSSGAVSAYSIDSATGKLEFLNQQPSMGADPCHVIVDQGGRFALAANYTGGSVSVFPLRRDGRLEPASQVIKHSGAGVREQQQGPHPHCVALDSSNRHAFVSDLGIDKLMSYRFRAETGRLEPDEEPWIQLGPGAGPRHFTFHPKERYAYVINELDSTITAFRYHKASGNLRLIHTQSTLPKDFLGRNDCADIHVSPSGKFLYGSNRGHDSIVVFAINEITGSLTHLEHVSTEGKTPRNFVIDPTGKFLLVANQKSDSIVSFHIDSITGRLKATGHVAEVPAPVCLKFV
jgi:6-phosphogluconolactonase